MWDFAALISSHFWVQDDGETLLIEFGFAYLEGISQRNNTHLPVTGLIPLFWGASTNAAHPISGNAGLHKSRHVPEQPGAPRVSSTSIEMLLETLGVVKQHSFLSKKWQARINKQKLPAPSRPLRSSWLQQQATRTEQQRAERPTCPGENG